MHVHWLTNMPCKCYGREVFTNTRKEAVGIDFVRFDVWFECLGGGGWGSREGRKVKLCKSSGGRGGGNMAFSSDGWDQTILGLLKRTRITLERLRARR